MLSCLITTKRHRQETSKDNRNMFLSKMLKVSAIILIIAVSLGSAGSKDKETKTRHYVENVKQNYNSNINKMLETQIGIELEASYIYQAYASYFQRADVNLPGIEKFFTKASAEEKQHAQLLIDYVNKRGGHVTFDDINLINTCTKVRKNEGQYYVNGDKSTRMCICSFIWPKEIHSECPARYQWENGLYAFEDALAVERFVNNELLTLHKAADEANDAQLAHFIEHDFLEEQVQAINELGHFVYRLRSFQGDSYSLGEYLFDQKLS